MKIRKLERREIPDIWSIDRAERIDRVYRLADGELVLEREHHDMQGWPPGEPERDGPGLLDCFDRGGTFYGAFEGETLIGAAVLESRFMGRAQDQLQLKFLHVGRRHRELGLGSTLFEKAVAKARQLGARRLYISATTSENTVRFYLRRGCRVTDEVDPGLFELEPEDIHLEFEIPVRRVDIDESLVGQLVAAQFPEWAELPIRPVELDGWDNRTFRLGEQMAVRLPSAEAYAGQVEKEQRWLPALAPLLPLPIPAPLTMGAPAAGYPWHWSVYRWLDGENATLERIDDLHAFAVALARFLAALQQIDPAGGPPPGWHNFFRGGPLATYAAETRDAISVLGGRIDTEAVTGAWEAALEATWHGPPVWVHGDVSAANLLVRGGELSAVIDFGCCSVGDPACDLAIAWTLFSGESREAFRAALPFDAATWARGRGWTLWKGLITLAKHIETDPSEAALARRAIDEVVSDHERTIHRGLRR